MKNVLLLFSVLIGLGIEKSVYAQYVPVTLSSGYNADVVANGTSTALGSTTHDVDGVNYCFHTAGYQPPGATAPTSYGLPANGTINSVASATPGLIFQLADLNPGANTHNTLRLATANATDTLEFQTPQSAENVYLLATSGSGTADFTGLILFTDNTTQAIGPITVPDWFGGTTYPAAISGFGRVVRNTDVLENPIGNPRLYQIDLPVDPANQSKQISGLKITKTNSGTSVLNVMGVSIKPAVSASCPPPSALSAGSLTTNSAVLSWTETGSATSWELKHGPAGFNVNTGGTLALVNTTPTYSLSGLSNTSDYDFYVRSICGPSDTSSWSAAGSFSTSCVAPAVTGTTAASRCGEGTVDLSATVSAGANIQWYADESGGPILSVSSPFTTPVLSHTDTFWVAAASGSGGPVVRITEIDLTDPDGLEIQNVGSAPVDVTGWRLAISASYTIITSVNTDVQTLSGVMAPSDIKTWTDASSSSGYWGSNMFWNPGNSGWALLLDNNDNIVDFVVWDWPAADVQATTLTIGSSSIPLAGSWTGPGINAAGGNTFQRIGTADNDDAADFAIANGTMGNTNSGLVLPFAGTGGCASARQPVIATINPLPEAALGNDTTICPGVTMSLDAGNPGASYSWSTTASTRSIQVNTPGTYSVEVRSPAGCTRTDSILITQGVNPLAVLQDSVSICGSDTITLDAGNAGSSYQWSTGASTQTIEVSAGGAYELRVTSTDGCVLQDRVVVTEFANPVVELGNDTAICIGDQVSFDAGNPGFRFQWSSGDTTRLVQASDSGVYRVVVTAPSGCTGTDSLRLNWRPAPYVEGFNFIPEFYENLGQIRFEMINPAYVTYAEWDFGDGSPALRSHIPMHIFRNTGSYEVTLTVYNNCGQYTVRQVIEVDLTTGLVTPATDHELPIIIYPNPARDVVRLRAEASTVQLKRVEIYNVLGQLVHRVAIDAQTDRYELNVSGLASGLYTLRLLTNKGWANRKFEKLR